jgi:hypothetical protein
MSVFIVYIPEDESLAEWLAASLKEQKFHILPLSPIEIDSATIAAMKRAKANIFLWTPESSQDDDMIQAARNAEMYGKYVPVNVDVTPDSKAPYTKFNSNIPGLSERLRGLGVGPSHVPPWEAFIVYAVLLAVFVLFYAYLNGGPRREALPPCDAQQTTPLSDPETPTNVRPCPTTRY